MNRETSYFIEVLRCALKREQPAPPTEEIDWSEFIRIAKKQEAYAVIAAALPPAYLPAEEAEKLNNFSKSELVRLIAMKSELGALEAELQKNEIPFMLLKGSVIRAYYPKESMRQMSDIDILYDIAKRDVLLSMMSERGYERISDGGNSDDFHKRPYYTFEFHHELFKDVYGFFPDFSFVWENAARSPVNSCQYEMSREDLYLHSVAHMYKHYLFGGFGIRFLLDTYLIVKAEEADWNRAYIDEKLSQLKLGDFEEEVRTLSFAVVDGTPLSEEQSAFLQNMFDTGVFGTQTNVDAVYSRFKEENRNSSRFAYLLQRLFPSKKKMVSDYRILEKKPYLLPAYYLYRLFRGAAKSKETVKEIKTIHHLEK